MNNLKHLLIIAGLLLVAQTSDAMSLNGSNQYVGSIGSVSSFNFVHQTGIFSITARIKLTNTTSRCSIFGNNAGASAQTGILFLYETIGGGNGLRALRLFGTKSNASIDCVFGVNSGTDTINDTNTHFVAVIATAPVVSGVTFYVDGVAYPAIVAPGLPMTGPGGGNATNQVSIGTVASGNTALPFNGSIEDVAIYNRALSEAEVKSLGLSNAHNFITTGRVGYWPMNEGTVGAAASGSNTVLDRSGNGYHGTPVNLPVFEGTRLSYQ